MLTHWPLQSNDPLEVSPANKEVSDPKEAGKNDTESGADKGSKRSGHKSPEKGKKI
jgi:hypothetical protein